MRRSYITPDDRRPRTCFDRCVVRGIAWLEGKGTLYYSVNTCPVCFKKNNHNEPYKKTKTR